jgi:DNA ligase (NAD+)
MKIQMNMISQAAAHERRERGLLVQLRNQIAEADPVTAARSMPIKDLVEVMKYLDDLYHNQGKPGVSDRVYDQLWQTLAERSPSNPYLKKVGAPPSGRTSSDRTSRSKVQLPYRLPSLSKLHPGTAQAEAWYRAPVKSKSWVVSDKLDGVSLLLVYSPSGLAAYTRGDSSVGQNVSALIPRLKNVPSLRGSGAVRGELIISKAAFEKTYSKDVKGAAEGFSSARSLVVGTVNRLQQSPALNDIQFIAYEVVSPDGQSPEQQFAWLKSKGFKVVNYKVLSSIQDSILSKLLQERKASSDFEVDGLVVTRNDSYRRTTADRPSYSIAFKDNAHTEHKIATVTDVVWRTTRGGVLAPRVKVTPVGLGGASVTYFSGFNAYFIEHGYPFKDRDKPGNSGKKFPIGPGAKLDVVKSGDVIPFIVRVIKPATRPAMPDIPYVYDETRINILAKASSAGFSDSDKERQAAVHLHFLKTIGVTDIGTGFAKKLVDNRVLTIENLISLKQEDLVSKLGLTETTATKIYTSIKNSLKKASLATLGDAIDAFGRGVGTQKLDVLFEALPNLLTLKIDTPIDKAKVLAKVSSIAGFSEATGQKILEGLPKFKKMVQNLGRSMTASIPRKIVGPASNLVVLFSRIRDKNLESEIKQQGGTVASAMRSDVTHLVVGDLSDTSTKIDAARKRGIPILTLSQFKKKFNF